MGLDREEERGPESVQDWLRQRRTIDGAENLWRVHDTLYDLTDFVAQHPGGSFWLRTTRGTDVTEAFESHVNHERVAAVLAKYAVRKATKPRTPMYTFAKDGFYSVLRSRVWEVLRTLPPGPTALTCKLGDGAMLAFVATAVYGALYASYFAAMAAGVFLALTMGVAHNFFHQRDNPRMYYFDLSMLSSRYWRVSHALSHHLYPNTLLDLEVTEYNPFFLFLPFQSRNSLQTHGPPWYAFPLNSLTMPIVLLKKLYRYVTGDEVPHAEDALVWAELAFFVGVGGTSGVWLWLCMHMSCSLFFLSVSLVAGTHHYHEIWHQGDHVQDRDFGIMQIEATRDRGSTVDANALAVYMFGDHVLHHLFPHVDSGKLPLLYPALEQTCADFNVRDVETLRISVTDAVRGFFVQTKRTAPHKHSNVKRH